MKKVTSTDLGAALKHAAAAFTPPPLRPDEESMLAKLDRELGVALPVVTIPGRRRRLTADRRLEKRPLRRWKSRP